MAVVHARAPGLFAAFACGWSAHLLLGEQPLAQRAMGNDAHRLKLPLACRALSEYGELDGCGSLDSLSAALALELDQRGHRLRLPRRRRRRRGRHASRRCGNGSGGSRKRSPSGCRVAYGRSDTPAPFLPATGRLGRAPSALARSTANAPTPEALDGTSRSATRARHWLPLRRRSCPSTALRRAMRWRFQRRGGRCLQRGRRSASSRSPRVGRPLRWGPRDRQ
jgi:hypothetical protein